MTKLNQLAILFTSIVLLSCTAINTIDQYRESLFLKTDNSWTTKGDVEWTISDGILSSENGKAYAITTSSYENFILDVEFNPDETMNSGIFIRCPNEEITASGCYEINIADNHENQEFRTGAIVTHGKPMEIVHSINKWNTFRIIAKNNRIGVWVNGVNTADLRDSKSRSGTIAMQVNGEGKIQFRNAVLSKLN